MAKKKRKSLSKKLRFEVLKRDSFTCQYCGAKSPDVVLNIDHIEPVAKGGTDDVLNLITSCFSCNSGKSDRRLSDNSAIERQRDQLDELQERKEQLEMLFEWKKGLMDIDTQAVAELSDIWASLASGFTLNDSGKASLRKLIKEFSVDAIIDGMETATERYLEYEDGAPTHDSVNRAFNKIGGICNNKMRAAKNPDSGRLFYIRAILRNRFHWIDEQQTIDLLQQAHELGATIESLEKHAKTSDRRSFWFDETTEFINEQRDGI